MNKNSVLAVIVLLLCCYPSFLSGENRIDKARWVLHKRYNRLIPYSRDPNTLRPRSTVYRHLIEVSRKRKTSHDWLQKYTGYPPEVLNHPPESFMSEDELTLATEYHLYLSGWYNVRFITLDKAAKRDSHDDTKYPHIDLCRNTALKAFKHSQKHNELYKLYYRSLGEASRLDLMKELKFTNNVNSEDQDNQKVVQKTIWSVSTHLKVLIDNLTQTPMDSRNVRKLSSIKTFLCPSRMAPDEDFMSNLGNSFPVEDLSLPPDKASRSDREFLKMAWLLNRYRSLWYEQRRHNLLKFLQHNKQDLKAGFIHRLKKAIRFNQKCFRRHQSLSDDYHEHFEKHQKRRVVLQHNPSTSHTMELNRQAPGSKDDGVQKCRESLNNVRSDTPKLVLPDALELVAIEVNDQTEERNHGAKRYRYLEADSQTKHQAKQRKFLGGFGPSDLNRPTENAICNEDQQAPPFMEIFQGFTKANPAESDLRFGAILGHAEAGLAYDDMAMAHIPHIGLLWNHQPHRITTNEMAPPAVECCQRVDSLPIKEQQYELIEVEMLEESVALKEIQEEEFLEFDSWLKSFLAEEQQTHDGSAAHEMRNCGQLGNMKSNKHHETSASSLRFSHIAEHEFVGEWEGRVELITNTAVHGQEILSENQMQRFQHDGCDAYTNFQPDALIPFGTLYSTHLPNTVHTENKDEPDLTGSKMDLPSHQSELGSKKRLYYMMEMNFGVNNE